MLTWAHERGLTLRLIEPGKPNQNAYLESFNGRFRDECLNEHWFTSLAHARAVIEDWRHRGDVDTSAPPRRLFIRASVCSPRLSHEFAHLVRQHG